VGGTGLDVALAGVRVLEVLEADLQQQLLLLLLLLIP
jgi:hypothetical protein